MSVSGEPDLWHGLMLGGEQPTLPLCAGTPLLTPHRASLPALAGSCSGCCLRRSRRQRFSSRLRARHSPHQPPSRSRNPRSSEPSPRPAHPKPAHRQPWPTNPGHQSATRHRQRTRPPCLLSPTRPSCRHLPSSTREPGFWSATQPSSPRFHHRVRVIVPGRRLRSVMARFAAESAARSAR